MAGELVTMGWWPMVFQVVNLILSGMILFLVFYYFRKAWNGFWQERKTGKNEKRSGWMRKKHF